MRVCILDSCLGVIACIFVDLLQCIGFVVDERMYHVDLWAELASIDSVIGRVMPYLG